MRMYRLVLLLTGVVGLSGCVALDQIFCGPSCRASSTRNSSSLVGFLYADGKSPPVEDVVPELRLPLRVGLAFLPTQSSNGDLALEAAEQEALMQKIQARFAGRKFISEIVVIPEYYLRNAKGFDGLQGVQRLYNVDLMALVSYDQVAHKDDNEWSLGYVTIVGAYFLKGSRHDISTLIDLAVVDPQTRSLVLRAGGVDNRHGNDTLIKQAREVRAASAAGFDAATTQMIGNFDAALTKFEADVRQGKAKVRVVNRGRFSGGGGAFDWLLLTGLGLVAGVRRYRRIV